MDLADLKARGALVAAPPVRKEVTWQPTDPVSGAPVGEPLTFDVFVRRPSAGWLDRARTAAARSINGISYRSALISHAILLGEAADQHFTYDEADLLQDSLAEVFYNAYLAVNAPPPPVENKEQAEEEFAKNMEPTLPSGTNSSEPASADAA